MKMLEMASGVNMKSITFSSCRKMLTSLQIRMKLAKCFIFNGMIWRGKLEENRRRYIINYIIH